MKKKVKAEKETRIESNTKDNSKQRKTRREADRYAGLNEITIKLDQDTINTLKELCAQQDYELTSRNTGHCFSNVIGAIIRSAANKTGIEDTPNRACQELYRMHKMIVTLSIDRNRSEIVDFLKTNKHKLPVELEGEFKLLPTDKWQQANVRRIRTIRRPDKIETLEVMMSKFKSDD